ncbi:MULTISPECIES: hypothetical protein [unclassified Fusibacter]|uniref:hypothetical protein n=1 Tax=unclassified Fusibacter TaxID=2624464 RepID=UPI0010105B2F|nr:MULTISPECIES: hypothetical protein [unclassified Fusibacter]MCK8060993.1 hypothetical protein [Fusibacter sp. A2]NPE20553.1 hypothetical protein [Fusibacter sp. A1]RXV63750.1 hypothetical protein DWB64_01880 [Fusibacter sp. A1]
MGSLLIAILFSASIALVFKWATGKGTHSMAVSFFNYIAATVMSLITLLSNPFLEDISFVSSMATVAIGFVTGIFFLGAFLTYQHAVAKSGASLSGMYMKMGILVPMIFALVIWKEVPTGIQFAGVAILMAAIVISNTTKDFKLEVNTSLVILFAVGGMAEFMNKFFQQTQPEHMKAVFLLTTFATAMVLSGTMLVLKKVKVTRLDMMTGIAVGIPNMLTSFFLIAALSVLNTSVVFAFYSAGAIATITIMSRILFGEKSNRRTRTALIITMFGLVLVNL